MWTFTAQQRTHGQRWPVSYSIPRTAFLSFVKMHRRLRAISISHLRLRSTFSATGPVSATGDIGVAGDYWPGDGEATDSIRLPVSGLKSMWCGIPVTLQSPSSAGIEWHHTSAGPTAGSRRSRSSVRRRVTWRVTVYQLLQSTNLIYVWVKWRVPHAGVCQWMRISLVRWLTTLI